MSLAPYNPTLAFANRVGAIGLSSGIMDRLRRSRNQFARRFGQAMGARVRQRQRNARSATLTRRRNKSTSGIGVTTQHDERLIYRKRRMPRNQRKRWKRFKSKVLAVAEKDLGTQTVVFNSLAQPQNQSTGSQLLFNCALYGNGSATNSLFNDLPAIGAANTGAVTTPGTGLSVDPSTKILFHSGVLDITMRNASTFNASGTPALDSRARMEVDVYEISCNLSDEAGATYGDLLALFSQNPTRTSSIGGGGVEVALPLRGVTPWDTTYVLSRFKIKIWRKTKYQISNGDQVTYQVRDPRRYVFQQRDLTATEGFTNKASRFVLVIGRVAPGLTVGSGIGTFQEQLDIGITRKYMYKVENWSEDRTSYI